MKSKLEVMTEHLDAEHEGSQMVLFPHEQRDPYVLRTFHRALHAEGDCSHRHPWDES